MHEIIIAYARVSRKGIYPLCVVVGDENVSRSAGDPPKAVQALQARDAPVREGILERRCVAESRQTLVSSCAG